MSASPFQRYLAEFLGTFGLLLSVTGAAIFTLFSGFEPLTRVLMISLAIGGGLTGGIYAFGDISGGHFNPAVTIGFWAAGRFPGRDVVPYIVAQLFGGLVGVAVILGVAHGWPALWTQVVTGSGGIASQGYAGNNSPYLFSMGSVLLLEIAFTFFFVSVILFATRGENSAKNLAPLAIGLTLLMINLVAIPVDGASVNPARSFAPALLAAYWTHYHWAIQQDWLFWVAPIVGGILAALVERAMHPKT
jgi:aquaporin Z